jgi:hypothetical protein
MGGARRYTVDPRVDTYIDRLPEWQQKICQQVRESKPHPSKTKKGSSGPNRG